MTGPQTAALATRDNSPSGMVQQYRDDFAAVLPTHVRADVWVRLAVGALRRDRKLAEAATNDPAALMGALLEAARLGHEPATEAFYLVPRKQKGVLKVQGIEGYQGIVERMYRAGAVSSVIVEVVRKHDRFRYIPGRDERPEHEIDWDLDDRGDLRLAYAYARMKGGAVSKVVVLNRKQIADLRAKSDGADSPYSPWNTNEESMWLKSAARQLRKWVPTSAEYMREQNPPVVPASTQALSALPHVDLDTGEVLDAMPVDDPPERDWPEVRQPAGGAV